MQNPERRVADGDALDQHVRAAVRLDERRPQKMTSAIDPLRDRYVKARARTAALAVFVIAALAVLLLIATR